MSEQTDQILATYDLPVGLLIDPDCAGAAGEIKVADAVGRIYFPLAWTESAENAADNPPQLIAPVISNLLTPAQNFLNALDAGDSGDSSSGSVWGGVLDWIEERQRFVLVVEKTVIFLNASQDRSPDEIMQILSDGIDSWFKTLVTWVRVVSDQDVSAEQYGSVSWSGHGLEMRRLSADTLHLPTQPSKRIRVNFRQCRQPLNRHQWQYVLSRAANAEILPIEYMLATSARVAARSNQFRQAVLDAATSVELSLNRILDGRLIEVASSSHGPTRDKFHTLGPLVSLLSKEDSLPAGISEPEIEAVIVKTRNHAIHNGQMPTSAEANSAAELAMNIARIVVPLPE